MFKAFDRNQAYGPLVLRVVLGVIFLFHGLQKFGVLGQGGLEGTAGFFGSLGIPLPSVMALVVALVETLGGLALILGLGTRIAAALLAITMLVALVTAKLPGAAGLQTYEFELALLAACVALLFLGSGAAALDRRFPALR